MAGKGGARPGSGRKPYTPSKKTIERAEAAAIRVEQSRAQGKKLAVEVLEEHMLYIAGMAARCQPDVNVPLDKQDTKLFERLVKLTSELAAELAQYQSPRYAAIRVNVLPPPGSFVPASEQRGDGAKVIDGKVIDMNDPNVVGRIYRDLMARPKVR
jgi:hypothetical protein